MSGEPDLEAALRAALAKGREEMDAPTPEELIAYHEGLLSVAERESVERRLASFPEAAHALRDLTRFPEVQRPADAPPLSEETLSTRWREFLGRAQPGRPSTPPPRRAAPAVPRRTRFGWRLAASLTAVAVAGGAAGLLIGRGPWRPPAKPEAGVPLLQLAPQGAAGERATEGAGHPAAAGSPLFVVLELPSGSRARSYAIEIAGPSGEAWRGSAEATPLRTLHVVLPDGFLVPGHYRVAVRTAAGQEVARYRFEVE